MSKPGRLGRVLVVDDHALNRKVLGGYLASVPCEVWEAVDGEQALATVAAAPPDVILLDVMMPGMDGYAVTQRLKADPHTATIPIVLVTSLSNSSDRLRGLEAGAEEFLTKPVDRVELVARVRTLLRLKRLHDERNAIGDLRQRALLETDLGTLMDAAVALIARMLDVELTGVWGLHPAGHLFLLDAGTGWKYGDVGHTNADAGPDSMLGYALGAPPVVVFDDLRTETRFPAPGILSDHEVVSGVNVLIPVQYQPFGVLGVYTTDARTFTSDEMQSLVAVAAVLATAIDRNRADSERAALLAREHAARVRLQESNQALARATQAKSEFLAAMSHELRTPLTSIMGFADLLLDDLQEGPEEVERRQQVVHIYQSGQHLLSLVNDILDLAKVEAGRMELHPSEFDVAAALHSVEYRIRPLAEKKTITISTEVAPEVTSVYADERKFHQVLYNLLSNAVKYTPDGGRVETTARVVDRTMEVIVADTGVGITPLEQARVFEAFQQLGNAAGQEQQGTGLGLALTRRLVELAGGHIWVESTPGQGSRFGFTIPVHVDGAERGPAESDPTGEIPYMPQVGDSGVSLERPPVLAEMVDLEDIAPAETTAQLSPIADETTVTLDEVPYEIASCVASSARSDGREISR